jgi:hypothetical protein
LALRAWAAKKFKGMVFAVQVFDIATFADIAAIPDD